MNISENETAVFAALQDKTKLRYPPEYFCDYPPRRLPEIVQQLNMDVQLIVEAIDKLVAKHILVERLVPQEWDTLNEDGSITRAPAPALINRVIAYAIAETDEAEELSKLVAKGRRAANNEL